MATSELEIIVQGTDRASGPLGGVKTALQGFGSAATKAGQDLLPLSAGAAVVAGSALLMAADYETSMNVLQAQSGATTTEMAALDAMAIALGADMALPGTSAADAAEAMLELSKAGLSVNDTLAASHGVLLLSAAGQLSNAEAAKITANALNVFGLAGSEATNVANLLAAAANASSADVRGIADSLQMVGSVAAMAGLPIKDTTTAIALMANAGIAGSDAGTSLKTMLMALMNPTAASAALMKDLGIQIYDANGKMLPMPQLIQQFGTALGGMTEQQRNATLATIFGSDAVRGANIVLMGGKTAWDEMSAAVGKGGAAQALASAQTAGLKGAFDGLRSTIETTLLTAARPLLDILTPLVQGIGNLVGQVSAAHPQLFTAGLAFAAVLAVAAPVALGIGMVATALGTLLAPVGLVVLAVGLLAAAWVTNFGGIQEKTAAVLAFVQENITRVMTFVQSFVTTAVTQTNGIWSSTWGTIQTTVQTVLGFIQSIVQSVLSIVQAFIAKHGDDIKAFMLAAWTTISQIIQTTVQIISLIVTTVFGAVAQFLSEHKEEIVAVLSAAWELIKGIVALALGIIQGVVKTVLAVLQGNWDGAWTAIKEMADTIWESIKTIITAALNLLLAFFGTNLAEVQAKFESVWTAIQTFFETTFTAIQTTAETIWTAISTFFETTFTAIQTLAETIWTAISTFFETTFTAIQTTAETIWTAISTFFETTFTAIQTTAETIWTAISTFFETTFTAIQTLATTIWTAIKAFLSGNMTDTQTLTTTIWTAISTFFETTFTAIQTLATTIWTAIRTFFTTIFTAIQTTAETIWTAIRNTAETTWDGIRDGVKKRAQDLYLGVRKSIADLAGWLVGAGETLYKMLTKPFEDIRERVLNIVNDMLGKIKGAFAGFKIHIPLPHFSVSWEDIGFGIKIPDVGVRWYGRGGDFVASSPMLIGVGEMGPERVQITPLGGGGGRSNTASQGESQTITININNPVVREELDIRRIAEAVSDALGGRANVNRRLGMVW